MHSTPQQRPFNFYSLSKWITTRTQIGLHQKNSGRVFSNFFWLNLSRFLLQNISENSNNKNLSGAKIIFFIENRWWLFDSPIQLIVESPTINPRAPIQGFPFRPGIPTNYTNCKLTINILWKISLIREVSGKIWSCVIQTIGSNANGWSLCKKSPRVQSLTALIIIKYLNVSLLENWPGQFLANFFEKLIIKT